MSIKSPPTESAEDAMDSYEAFERRLVDTLGAMVGGGALTKALGFPSQDAFRKAYQRGRIPVSTFEIEGRRGRYAVTLEVAGWMWTQRERGDRARDARGGGS